MNAILCIEELAKFSPMIAAPVFESNVGPVRVIDIFGTEEQKKTIMPGVCRGELSVSVCMTEPEAGSDLTALTTRAVEDGDSYILNGRKCFITGGGHASHYMVYTRFGDIKGYKGIGGLLVEKGMPGFSFGKQEKFMGLRGMPSCDLFFDDVRVPEEKPGHTAGGVQQAHVDLRYRAVRQRRDVPGHSRRRARGGEGLCHGTQGLRQAHLRIPGGAVHDGGYRR